MSEPIVPRGTRGPIVIALGMAPREVAERRAAERLERPPTMAVADEAMELSHFEPAHETEGEPAP